MDSVERFHIQRVTDGVRQDAEGMVIREIPLTIILNNRELVTLLCSPAGLDYLAVGFLASEGLLDGRDEIKKIMVDEQRGVVRVETTEDKESASEMVFKRLITSGCGRGASFYSAADATSRKVESELTMSTGEIFDLVKAFQHSSKVYLATHGAHSSALCGGKGILVFGEDIGRHNAIDKIFGECLLKGIQTKDHVIITSGRVSSEILHKVAKRDIPILITIAVPSNVGVKLADELGITLVGFIRGRGMNIYTHGWRIATDGK